MLTKEYVALYYNDDDDVPISDRIFELRVVFVVRNLNVVLIVKKKRQSINSSAKRVIKKM